MSCYKNLIKIFASHYQYSIFKVHLIRFPLCNGDGEIRTLDPLLARQVLSQLSYAPGFLYLWA